MFTFSTMCMFYLFFAVPQETVPVPTDIRVWGGLSLALVFRAVIVPALLAFGILKDDNKKTVGAVLGVLGLLAGAVYSVFSANLTDFQAIITNLAAGGFAGAGAIGFHSGVKNFKEWMGIRAKKSE